MKVPYFNSADVELMEATEPFDEAGASALEAFLSLTSADRISDSQHIFAYFKDVCEGGEKLGWLDESVQISDNPAEIWDHVTPSNIFLDREEDGGRNWYVVIEAECAWEAEHGLMMVWRRGKVLNKVGMYDGHLTNVHAFDDDSLGDVVYAAANPKYITRMTASSGTV